MNFAMGMNTVYSEEAKREVAAEKADKAIAYSYKKSANHFNFFNMFHGLFH